jgi:non-heme Fe2+,alpha-ketoglutarate-dependent halogenase
MSGLSDEVVAAYHTQGFTNRIPALSAEEAAEWLAKLTEIEAAQVAAGGGRWHPRDYRPWEQDDHPLREWISALVRHPGILEPVAAILGPDVLVRNADIFIKEPGGRRDIGWHVDTAEKGPDADLLLTAWIGLTASTRDNGCLRYAAGSHRLDIPDAPQDKYHLTFSKTAVAALDPASVVYNEMEPGMMSLHHFRLAHASGANRSTERRVGFVVRFMAPAISQATAESGVATLVRGADHHRHFTLRDRFPMTWTS